MRVDSLNVSYVSGPVYTDFSANFEERDITVVLGPSGCGKTTLLHAIADSESSSRAISFVFQEPRLIPWVSLRSNLKYALASAGYSNRDLRRRIDTYLDMVGLLPRADERPDALSGGERQRVSIARAFANPASTLLMDEPFQSQDPATKAQLISVFLDIQSREHRTVIAVTHNLEETERFGDWLMLLTGKPARVAFYERNEKAARDTLKTLIL